MRRDDKIYQELYGDIPDDPIDRIAYILGKKANNEAYNLMIQKEARKIKRIKKHKITFTMWKIVKPSARPRVSSRNTGFSHMYVPGAAQNGDWFQDFAKENKLPFIDTPCKLDILVYEKTPSNFNIKNKVLAELGIIRPWKRTGDFDNYAKGIADAIQHGMLKDDCLVVSSSQELYYSIKPHAVVTVEWYDKHPGDILNLK